MDWIAITCWAVLGVSGLVTLWALFWDRPRGRLRCRNCAYDMSGGGLRCPECGREYKSEKLLRKARRKWKSAILSLVLITLTVHVQQERDRVRYEGLIGLVPTAVLVVFANPQDYLNEIKGYSVAPASFVDQTLTDRLYNCDACSISRRYWMSRIARIYRSEHAQSSQIVRQYDLSCIAPLSEIVENNSMSCFPSISSGRMVRYYRNDRAARLIDLIEEIVQIEEWVDNGGDNASCLLICDQLLIVAPSELHDEVYQRFAELRKNKWMLGQPALGLPDTDQKYLVVYEISEFQGLGELDLWSRKYFLEEKIEQSVEPHLWQPDGYGAARIYMEDSGFTVWTTPAHHREIMVFLNAE